MHVAVVTVVHGRHDHLRRQLDGLDRSGVRPAEHVVVAVDDPAVPRLVRGAGVPTRVVPLRVRSGGFPIARARNLGAREALAHGAEVLLFLDVDCIPSAQLASRYERAARTHPDALLSGPVAYLAPPPTGGYQPATLRETPGHPDRPVPPDDALLTGADHRLFWSLSFAVTEGTWSQLGGFCEQYTGYGAEDTDLGQIAARRGIDHAWVGGAWAYHQWHPTNEPPTDRLADIVRNANLFHQRWGWWPMAGWLEAFATRGLVRCVDGRWQSC